MKRTTEGAPKAPRFVVVARNLSGVEVQRLETDAESTHPTVRLMAGGKPVQPRDVEGLAEFEPYFQSGVADALDAGLARRLVVRVLGIADAAPTLTPASAETGGPA